MNKYNKDVVALQDMPGKVQAQIKATRPYTKVDVAVTGDAGTWISLSGKCEPAYIGNLAYRVRPKGVKPIILDAAKPGPAKKVAKVYIHCVSGAWWYSLYIGGCRCVMENSVARKSTVIRKAQKFCASIGYECVIKE